MILELRSSKRRLAPLFGGAVAALSVLLFGCGGGDSGTSTASSQLTTTDADGSAPSDPTACLTSYVECVRAGSAGDAATCRDALHTCLRPAHDEGGDHGDGGPGDCHGGGPGRGPGGGGPGGAGHPPDGRGDGDGDRPPPGDGGAPPQGGPGGCIDALDTCASGTDAADACVATAVACIAAAPRPPHGGHPH